MPALRSKVLLWVALAAVLAVHGAMLHGVRQRILDGEVDFTAFYSAARVVNEGHGSELYQFRTQQQFQRDFRARRTPLLFYHPPFELLLFLPLARLAFVPAYAAWMGLNLSLLAGLAYLRHPYTESFPRFRGLQTLVLALAFFPIGWSMVQGQDSILLVLLFTLAWIAMRHGQSFRAGCFLALGLFKFQFVLPFMVVLVVRRNWKALRGFFLTAFGLGLASLAPVGWQGARSYADFLLEINQRLAYGTIGPAGMPNVRGLVTALSGMALPAPWPVAIIAVVSLLLLILAARHWPQEDQTTRERFDLVFALNLLVTLLVSYHLNLHDLTILFLFCGLVCRHLAVTQGLARITGKTLCLCMTALFLPPMVMPSTLLRPNPAAWLLLILLIALLAEMRTVSRMANANSLNILPLSS